MWLLMYECRAHKPQPSLLTHTHTAACHNSAWQLSGQESLLKQREVDFKAAAAVRGLFPLYLRLFSIRISFKSVFIRQNKNFRSCLVSRTCVVVLCWHGHWLIMNTQKKCEIRCQLSPTWGGNTTPIIYSPRQTDFCSSVCKWLRIC